MLSNAMDADPHSLGQRIAGLRHAQGWSQRRLAEAAGVSHGYVAQLELGRLPSPGKFRLDAIAHALNLRTSDALFGPMAASTAAGPVAQAADADADAAWDGYAPPSPADRSSATERPLRA